MTEKLFYPAVQLGEFEDAYTALFSVGIVGQAAVAIASELCGDPDLTVTYRARVSDESSETNTVLVLAHTDRGTVNLCLGYLDLASCSREGAARTAVDAVLDNVLSGEISIVPTFYVFELAFPRRTLQ